MLKRKLIPVHDVIPEKNIVIFSPHFDDFLFTLGGYALEMRNAELISEKSFHIITIFSRSNYLAGTGEKNFNRTLERIKLATGKRLLEDTSCIDELLGRYNYKYELLNEDECLVRGKNLADSEMEYPHGTFDDFSSEDWEVFQRIKNCIHFYAQRKETALIFPIAFKEHIDHFLTREAAIAFLKEQNTAPNAAFYFQEDKPYGGIADATEMERTDEFIDGNNLIPKTYSYNPHAIIELAFKHYISQVQEVYKKGILLRADVLREEVKSDKPCDRIYLYPKSGSSFFKNSHVKGT